LFPGLECSAFQTGEIQGLAKWKNRRVLTGKFSDRANRHMGNTSATATATLAAINALKERRRGRFVTVEGTAPRREAYRGSVHDDEKINAVEPTEMLKKHYHECCWAALN
jgi:hypothetical protein